MNITVDSGKLEPTQPLRDVPRENWRELMQMRRLFLKTQLPYDCRCLIQFVEEAEEMFEALGFESVEDMVKRGFELDQKEIRLADEWLQVNCPAEDRSALQPILGKRGAPAGNKNAAKQKGENKVGNANVVLKGNTARYLLARLRRDRPDLAARVDSKEITANAAAIEAGFRRKTVTVPGDDVRAAVAALARVYGADAVREAANEIGEGK